MNNYDIIIIGAGLSGLTLALELSKKTAKSILILEKKRKLFFDKNSEILIAYNSGWLLH